MTNKQFQTALNRRRGKAPTFTIAHWVFNDPHEDDSGIVVKDEEGHELIAELMADPMLDMIRLGALFGQYGDDLKALQDDVHMEATEKAGRIAALMDQGRDRLRECIVPQPSQRKLYDQVKAGIDPTTFAGIVQYLMQELSPVDPMQPPSLSAGSPITGESSTAGQQPAT